MIVRDGCDWDDEDEALDPDGVVEQAKLQRIRRCQALAASSRFHAAEAEGTASAVARAATTAAEQARATRIAASAVETALTKRSSVVSYTDLISALDGTARAGRIAARATRNLAGGPDPEATKAMTRAGAQLASAVSLADFASLAVRVDKCIGESVNLASKVAQAAALAASTTAIVAAALSQEADQYDAELVSTLQAVAVVATDDALLEHPNAVAIRGTKQSALARKVTNLIAVRLLPPQHRERYAEEWAAEIGALADGGSSRMAQVTYALALSAHAGPLRMVLSRPDRRRTLR